ncbi:MAG: restriction endonuclease subunit S [Chloroflexi bacterium]|nr:restriction endonuclease subunit S [Chloroflexota bacterium]
MRNEWCAAALGNISSISLSGVDKHIIPGEASIYLCNYLDVYRNRRLDRSIELAAGSATAGEIARFQLRKGDVLITKDSETPDDIGIPAVVVEDLPNTVCGYHLAMIRPNGDIDSGFLGHFLQSEAAKRHFLRHATGVIRFGLGMRAIGSLPVPIPELHEQAAITRVLDAVDAAVECARSAVERAREVRASLLNDLLTLGVDQNGLVRDPSRAPEMFARTPLGLLPAAWRLSTVGTEFALQTGFTLNEERRPRYRKRSYLRVANVQRETLLLDDIQELEASDAEFAPRVLAVDDLLVVEGHADRMQIGRCARVRHDASGLTFQNHLFRLRACGNVLPRFGCLWLNSTYAQRYWNAHCATSSGLNTINQRMLKRLVISIPPDPEQRAIAEVATKQRQHLEALVTRQRSLEQLKKSLMRDLLTGTVRLAPQRVEVLVAS